MEQRGTVETITVAEQSDRGAVHTSKDEGRGGIMLLCMSPYPHAHMHTLDCSMPEMRSNLMQGPNTLIMTSSINQHSYFAAVWNLCLLVLEIC